MKRLYMLAITSLLMAACAEDTEMNRENSPLISFSVSDPAAVAEPQSHPSSAATRTYQAPDVFTPGNSLFGDSIYTNPVPQAAPQQARWHQEPLKGDYPEQLCMLVSQEQWHPQAATPAADRTRAVETTQSALNASGQAIQVNATGLYTGQATYSSASSKFEPNTATAWPTTGDGSTPYTVNAYHPATLTGSGLTVSGNDFTYTLPATSAAQVDLLGTSESHSYNEKKDGSISLTLNHLLAPVCFKLAAGVKGTITSIKFSSIVTKATHTLGTTHATYGYGWTASTTGEYTATVSGTGGASEVQVDGTHYFMMIPQTVAAGVVVTITITDGASQSNTLTYTVPSGGQVWKAGEVTTYTISQTAVTSLSLTYPQWTLSGGSTTTYGPVDNYDVTTENYGYVGLFAVDKSNKIVISNAKVKITSAANHIGTCDLTNAANTAVLGNYILSQNYTYYVMYPYSTTATGLSTLAAGNTSPGSNADTFFANVTAEWTVQTDQSTASAANYKASDLQVAKCAPASSAATFQMSHQMGLLKATIPAAAVADNVIVYNGNTYNSGASGEKWTRITAECTSAIWNASTTFTSSTNKPYYDTTNKILYYVAKAEDATISISATAGTQLYAWSVSGNNTTVSNKNVCKSFTIVTPDYSNAYIKKIWKFSYSGSPTQWVSPVAGYYILECWGAQGASYTASGYTSTGGKGAYVKGKANLTSSKTLYVYVGQCPSSYQGGWNGGGTNTAGLPSGGGGATDISLRNGNWNSDTHLYSRIIVAGGGGGGAMEVAPNTWNGGNGGAWAGTDGQGQDPGHGGQLNGPGANGNALMSPTAASFGSGGSGGWGASQPSEPLGAGGGGWYGGGTAGGGGNNGGGGGGSSYAWSTTDNLHTYYPASSYKPTTSDYLTDLSKTAGSRTGNGEARITYTKP